MQRGDQTVPGRPSFCLPSLAWRLVSVSVLLFGSCHLILIVSSTNSIPIVRQQRCLLPWPVALSPCFWVLTRTILALQRIMGRLMEYSQVGHFGWILAPIHILDRETQNVYLEHGKSHVL